MEMLGYHHCDGKLGWTDYLHEGMLSVGYEIRRLTGKLDLTGTLGYADGRNHVMWNRVARRKILLGRIKKNYYLEMLTAIAIGW